LHPVGVLGRSTSRPQRALEVSASTAAARELLVAFCFCLCTVAAGNGRTAGRLDDAMVGS
jgi:hypothetical protein